MSGTAGGSAEAGKRTVKYAPGFAEINFAGAAVYLSASMFCARSIKCKLIFYKIRAFANCEGSFFTDNMN